MLWGSRIWKIFSIEVNEINVVRVENMEDIVLKWMRFNVVRVENMEDIKYWSELRLMSWRVKNMEDISIEVKWDNVWGSRIWKILVLKWMKINVMRVDNMEDISI